MARGGSEGRGSPDGIKVRPVMMGVDGGGSSLIGVNLSSKGGRPKLRKTHLISAHGVQKLKLSKEKVDQDME